MGGTSFLHRYCYGNRDDKVGVNALYGRDLISTQLTTCLTFISENCVNALYGRDLISTQLCLVM